MVRDLVLRHGLPADGFASDRNRQPARRSLRPDHRSVRNLRLRSPPSVKPYCRRALPANSCLLRALRLPRHRRAGRRGRAGLTAVGVYGGHRRRAARRQGAAAVDAWARTASSALTPTVAPIAVRPSPTLLTSTWTTSTSAAATCSSTSWRGDRRRGGFAIVARQGSPPSAAFGCAGRSRDRRPARGELPAHHRLGSRVPGPDRCPSERQARPHAAEIANSHQRACILYVQPAPGVPRSELGHRTALMRTLDRLGYADLCDEYYDQN